MLCAKFVSLDPTIQGANGVSPPIFRETPDRILLSTTLNGVFRLRQTAQTAQSCLFSPKRNSAPVAPSTRETALSCGFA